MELFPSKYIHIGGDECLTLNWEKCPRCQNVINENNLVNEKGLYGYFTKKIEEYVLKNGRRIIGWDEIIEGGIKKTPVVQSWRGVKGAVTAATKGNKTIVSPLSHTYFDYPSSIRDLEKVYSFDPIPGNLEPEFHKNILGSEACLWTEFVKEENVDKMVFPRLLAISELLWSQKKENYNAFNLRVKNHYEFLEHNGIVSGSEKGPMVETFKFILNTIFVSIKLFWRYPRTVIPLIKNFLQLLKNSRK